MRSTNASKYNNDKQNIDTNSDLKYAHPCVFIDTLTDDVRWVEEVIKMLIEVFDIEVWRDAVIDTSSGVCVDMTIEVVSDIGVGVLVDVKAGDLVPAITSL